ncbi:N2,N2-dimethylguanosine tRNA methyltransferase [Methanohalobium evestigatum Z-7303]|uniref:tRNA (guanine(26)-N(2))-dimethyltransferase n=1 Tax=Methanohalobium evestigatum (strain ATCC BAA-1072 / DSM 3721 / NBRC 107634 / OCM 161 / Z-7303) TaxID=644295 RepID=D7EAU5_METEZ|nr:tRNA (guanine(10)-N(2))-dimethyltransferase [Methanohalobium evestigatum]ADI74462.1 N2,N2-dimethylguanosine tRNA methyltransferase [Methanohalobium evestigatum Z-7303]
MSYKTVTEGLTKIWIPEPPQDASFPPSSASVFYNPEMELNRDITVVANAVFAQRLSAKYGLAPSDVKYADALAASGARGIRVSNETGLDTTLNDWNEEAYKLILKNAELNDVLDLTTVFSKNANVLLFENRYDIVDLDPFGTPIPYLESAIYSTRHLLEITATDTAPLCGAHLKSGIRKYSAVPLNNEYHREMGVRILLGKVAREFAKYDKAMIPILSHATRHYVRTYLHVKKGAKRADDALKYMGFISHCDKCGFRKTVYGLAVSIDNNCPLCGNKTSIGGPLWLGSLHETDFCNEILQEIDNHQLNKRENTRKIITLCRDELEYPTYYDLHLICKRQGVSAVSMNRLIDLLIANGYSASRTHFSGTSFKTDAGIDVINDIVHSSFSR